MCVALVSVCVCVFVCVCVCLCVCVRVRVSVPRRTRSRSCSEAALCCPDVSSGVRMSGSARPARPAVALSGRVSCGATVHTGRAIGSCRPTVIVPLPDNPSFRAVSVGRIKRSWSAVPGTLNIYELL